MDFPAPLDEPPVLIERPAAQTRPVVLASPHSGRTYKADFVAASRLDPLRLRRSEDGFVDELFAEAPAHGMPLLRATFPRAWCDANREAWELDPGMFADALPSWVNSTSPRVAAGLGTIARVVASGEPIYRGRLRFAEAEARIAGYWMPFHAALEGLIDETRAAFGACLLLDCHSMPSASVVPRHGYDIVLGDLHGTSCKPAVTRLVETALRDAGFAVRRNDPYAGGYITRHYGRPREAVHTLQLEICRGLYMDEAKIAPSRDFDAVRERLNGLMSALADAAAAIGG